MTNHQVGEMQEKWILEKCLKCQRHLNLFLLAISAFRFLFKILLNNDLII